jgi:hypothetical protein
MFKINSYLEEYASLIGYASSKEKAKTMGKNEFLSWECMEENCKYNLIMVDINTNEARLYLLWFEIDAYRRSDFIYYLHTTIFNLKLLGIDK